MCREAGAARPLCSHLEPAVLESLGSVERQRIDAGGAGVEQAGGIEQTGQEPDRCAGARQVELGPPRCEADC